MYLDYNRGPFIITKTYSMFQSVSVRTWLFFTQVEYNHYQHSIRQANKFTSRNLTFLKLKKGIKISDKTYSPYNESFSMSVLSFLRLEVTCRELAASLQRPQCTGFMQGEVSKPDTEAYQESARGKESQTRKLGALQRMQGSKRCRKNGQRSSKTACESKICSGKYRKGTEK